MILNDFHWFSLGFQRFLKVSIGFPKVFNIFGDFQLYSFGFSKILVIFESFPQGLNHLNVLLIKSLYLGSLLRAST